MNGYSLPKEKTAMKKFQRVTVTETHTRLTLNVYLPQDMHRWVNRFPDLFKGNALKAVLISESELEKLIRCYRDNFQGNFGFLRRSVWHEADAMKTIEIRQRAKKAFGMEGMETSLPIPITVPGLRRPVNVFLIAGDFERGES